MLYILQILKLNYLLYYLKNMWNVLSCNFLRSTSLKLESILLTVHLSHLFVTTYSLLMVCEVSLTINGVLD